MGKKQYDRIKHSGKKNAYDTKKNSTKGGKGWGDALTDYAQDYEEEKEVDSYYTYKEEATPIPIAGNKSANKTQNDISTWSIDQVEKWIRSQGSLFGKYADAFKQCLVDGEVLLELSLEDLQATCGKGLAVKKLWIEITKLRNAENKKKQNIVKIKSDEFPSLSPKPKGKVQQIDEVEPIMAPPRERAPKFEGQWWFYGTQGWKKFEESENNRIEYAWQNRLELFVRGWKLNLTYDTPYAEKGFNKRILHRAANSSDRPEADDVLLDKNAEDIIAATPHVGRPVLSPGVELSMAAPRPKYFYSVDKIQVFNDLKQAAAGGNANSFYTIESLSVIKVQSMKNGVAKIDFPVEGCISLFHPSTREKPLVKRLFMVDGIPHVSEDVFDFDTMDDALKAAQEGKITGSCNLELYDSNDNVIGEFPGDGSSDDIKTAVLEETEDGIVIHTVLIQSVDGYCTIPELLIVKSKKAIAWNLLKTELKRNGLNKGQLIKFELGFRSKSKVDETGEVLKLLPNTVKKNRNVLNAEGKVNRKYWMDKAIELKKDALEKVKQTALRKLNVPAIEKKLGICGPLEANLGRFLQNISEESLSDYVNNSADLTQDDDETYQLFRIFLRYNNVLTATLGELLEEEFDSDIVDIVISFLDCGGKEDYMKNAKGCDAFSSTGSRCLDFYASYQPDKKVLLETLAPRLEAMWNEHPETCVRLMFYLGGARSGKQDLHGFYCCMHWLFLHHPLTLLANIHLLPEVNYYKGMLEILERILENDETGRQARMQWYSKQKTKVKNDDATTKFVGKQCYKLNDLEKARKCIIKYDDDLVFRALHNKVSTLFASNLKEDIQKKWNLTLAAKWCPSADGKHDKSLLMHEAVCRKVFPPTLAEYKDLSEFDYLRKIRNRLRKEVLTPLRKRLYIPETFISRRQASKLDYSKMPGASLKKHQNTIQLQDPEGWAKYTLALASGKTKANVGAIGPVELYLKMKELYQRNCRSPLDNNNSEVAILNGQWNTLVDKLRKKIPEAERSLCAAVDLSGSMSAGTNDPKANCFDIGIALALVCSELSEGGYKDHLIMFESRAVMREITGETFADRFHSFESQRISGGTYYDPIFQCVADHALTLGMPRRIIILSDMAFGSSSCGTNVEKCIEVFLEDKCKALEKRDGVDIFRPEVVFWNISGRSNPARKTTSRASMISGYSANVFSDVICNAWREMNRDKITGKKVNDPLTVMLCALNKPLFKQIRVVKSKTEALDLLSENILDSDGDSAPLDIAAVLLQKEQEKKKKKAVAQPTVSLTNFNAVKCSVQSALCLIPPQECWGQIQTIRSAHDKAFARWMPHINFFFPFIEDVGNNFAAFTEEVLKPVCAGISSFEIQLDHMEHFKLKKHAQLFVGPNSTTELVSLWEALKKKMPPKVIERNRPNFAPHLSLGQFKKNEIDNVMSQKQNTWTPIPWTVDRIYVISRDGNVPFEIKHEIMLGSAATGETSI